MKPWIKYTIARIGLFAVVFAVLYPLLLNAHIMTSMSAGLASATLAAVVAFAISYFALGRLRTDVATDIAVRRVKPAGGAGADEEAEDALEGDGPGESKPE